MLECRHLTVRYDQTTALSDVTLTIPVGTRLSVIGPSGSGKSTLLRTVAGLVDSAGGTVRWNGEDVTATRPDQRRFGLMFQEHALFPHRDVAANVAFGLRMHRWEATAIEDRVQEMLSLVGLTGMHRRRIDELSGGERQRVALARTLAPRPRLVMLDEPLASLDRVLRTDLLDEMVEIFDALDVTAIAVTHDLDEAFRFGHHLALMSRGRIERTGPAADVWDTPETEFSARFLGYSPVGSATVTATGFDAAWGSVDATSPSRIGSSQTIAIAPGGFVVETDGPIAGDIHRVSFERGTWRHVVVLGDGAEVVVDAGKRLTGALRLGVSPKAVRQVQPTSSDV